PLLTTNWRAYVPNGLFELPKYRKFAGVVELKGLLQNIDAVPSTTSQTVCTLPLGYRPARQVVIKSMSSGALITATGTQSAGSVAHTHPFGLSNKTMPIYVYPNGEVRIQVGQGGSYAATMPANGWLTLSGVYFPLD